MVRRTETDRELLLAPLSRWRRVWSRSEADCACRRHLQHVGQRWIAPSPLTIHVAASVRVAASVAVQYANHVCRTSGRGACRAAREQTRRPTAGPVNDCETRTPQNEAQACPSRPERVEGSLNPTQFPTAASSIAGVNPGLEASWLGVVCPSRTPGRGLQRYRRSGLHELESCSELTPVRFFHLDIEVASRFLDIAER